MKISSLTVKILQGKQMLRKKKLFWFKNLKILKNKRNKTPKPKYMQYVVFTNCAGIIYKNYCLTGGHVQTPSGQAVLPQSVVHRLVQPHELSHCHLLLRHWPNARLERLRRITIKPLWRKILFIKKKANGFLQKSSFKTE